MKSPAITIKGKEETYELEILRRMITEINDYAIIRMDKNGIIDSWNSGAEKIKGYAASEIIGQSFERFYSAKDRKEGKPQRLLREVDQFNQAVDEGWRIKKDGTKFWASVTITAIHDDDNQVCGYSKVTRDLTEKKQAEENMRLLHKAIDEIEDYAIILLDIDGRIINWNKGAENIKGYNSREILGKSFRQFYTIADLDNQRPDKLLARARAEGRSEDEGWRVKKGGKLFWANVTITAIHNEDGKITGYSKVTRDLTERMKAAEKLKQRSQELQAKNDELNQFAYIASHDLKEPLNTIQSSLQILKEDYLADADETAGQLTRYMLEATERMGELIKGLLEYGRLGQKSEVESFSVKDILDEVISDLDHRIKDSKARIIIQDMPQISAYRTELRLVFQNLLSNAIKFHRENHPPVVKVKFSEKAGEWVFEVKDNGIGIAERHMPKLFMIFRRLHTAEKFEGTGIGLAHCKKILELHNGHIWVESKPGKGSSFFFSIPKSLSVERKKKQEKVLH